MNEKVLLDMYLRKNLGDDIFLKIILERYPNIYFYTLPQSDYNKKYYKNNVIFRRNIFTRLFNVIYKKTNLNAFNVLNYHKKKSNYLITLGGSMFIEKESVNKNIVYNKYNNIPYFILGSNFGPYKSDSYYNLYKDIFKNAKDVCFREKYSYDLFNDLKNVRYTKDIVFSLDTTKYNIVNKNKVIISVIDLSKKIDLCDYKEEYENKIIELSNYFIKNKYNVILMSFCKGEGDEDAIERIYNNLDSNLVSKYYYDGNIDEAINEIAEAEYVVASRFHAMILGFIFKKKVLPIAYSKKTVNVIEDLNFDGLYINIKDINNFDINKQFNQIKCLNKDTKKLKRDAEKQFEILDKYLK